MQKIYTITCVIGTRPEVLKMAPLIKALQAIENIQVNTIVTAQHRSLLDQMLAHFEIEITADFNIMTENQQLDKLTANLLEKFSEYFKQYPCDLLIAQGDTTTTMVSALTAFYHDIPFVHIEAGLRTDDIRIPFPEELNRRITSLIASIHCCPTEVSQQNLEKESITENVFVTGNTIIDTLYSFTNKLSPIKNQHKRTILVTAHRRENFGEPLENICLALKNIIENNPNVEFIFPVHPNPNVKKTVYKHLDNIDRIKLSSHLDYEQLTTVLMDCHFVLTDSGGLQEEAPALGKPVLILRDKTERPEGVACGVAKIVGTQTNNIISHVNELLNNEELYQKMSTTICPYGDGKSSQRITEIIINYLNN